MRQGARQLNRSKRLHSLIKAMLAVTLAALPTPTIAADEGTREFRQTKRAIATIEGATDCMLRRNAGQVHAFMATVPGSREEYRISHYMYDRMGHCLSGTVWMSGALIRGVIAELLFNERFPPSTDRPGEVPAANEFGPLSEAMEIGSEYIAGYTFARCLTMAELETVRALVRSPAASVEETRQFAALRPAMSDCVTEGATFSTDRLTLRALLAQAVYQYSRTRDFPITATASQAQTLETAE